MASTTPILRFAAGLGFPGADDQDAAITGNIARVAGRITNGTLTVVRPGCGALDPVSLARG